MIEVTPDAKFYSASDLVPKWKLVLGQIIDFMDGRTRAISQAAETQSMSASLTISSCW